MNSICKVAALEVQCKQRYRTEPLKGLGGGKKIRMGDFFFSKTPPPKLDIGYDHESTLIHVSLVMNK